jgi:hypothetical protein
MLVGSDAAGSGSAAVANDGGFHSDANGQRFDVSQCGLFDPLALVKLMRGRASCGKASY